MNPHRNNFNMVVERRLNLASLVCYGSVLRFHGPKDGGTQVLREATEWLGSIPETMGDDRALLVDRLTRAEKVL